MAETATAPVVAAPLTAPAAPTIDLKANPFSAVDTRAKTLPPKPEPKKEETTDKVETAPEVKATEKPVATKEDRTAKDPKWFREQHEKSQAEIKTYAERIKSLESRIAEGEKQGHDMTVLNERLAHVEKERDEAKAEARAARQEVSPEFKEKWDKPFDNAADYARNVVTQLQAGEWKQDENTGMKQWEANRPATWDDFAGLYALPMNKAAAMARNMFGDDAPIVIQQLTDLHRRDYERSAALQEEKVRWKENTTKEEAQRLQHEKGFQSMRAIADKHLVESNPDYQDTPGDDGKEARELRQQGYGIFDARPATIQEAAIKAADIRHRVAAFAPLVRERNSLREQLKEAQAQIEEMRGNGPTKGSKASAATGGTEKHWSDELRETVPAGMP